MTRVAIADDHTLVRDGIRRILALDPALVNVGEAASGWEALDLSQRASPDVLLLDLSMPGPHSTELIAELSRRAPQMRIMVLSMHNEPQIARAALRAGAAGYLTKDCEPELLLSSILRVARGARVIQPELATAIAFAADDGVEAAPAAPHQQLSRRELEVLALIAQGHSIQGIGARLFISPKTVSTHKHRIMTKLGLRSNTQLMLYCIRHRVGADAASA